MLVLQALFLRVALSAAHPVVAEDTTTTTSITPPSLSLIYCSFKTLGAMMVCMEEGDLKTFGEQIIIQCIPSCFSMEIVHLKEQDMISLFKVDHWKKVTSHIASRLPSRIHSGIVVDTRIPGSPKLTFTQHKHEPKSELEHPV